MSVAVKLATSSAVVDIDARLERIERALDELRAVVAPDLAQRAAVLAALRDEFAGANFTALDALECAAARPGGAIARALVPLLGAPVGGLPRFSKRLARLVGKPAGGLALVRVGDDRGAALYVVANVTETA